MFDDPGQSESCYIKETFFFLFLRLSFVEKSSKAVKNLSEQYATIYDNSTWAEANKQFNSLFED